jgi:hypothetical protein
MVAQKRKRSFRYDYYTVSVPGEAYDNDEEKICQAAIDIARENAKLYCMPAHWYASIVDSSGYETEVRVCRKRNNTAKA